MAHPAVSSQKHLVNLCLVAELIVQATWVQKRMGVDRTSAAIFLQMELSVPSGT